MKTVQIHEIDFKTNDDAFKTKNYPNSGLFLVRLEEGQSDLRIVDKSTQNSYCICPESIFNSVTTTYIDLGQTELITEPASNKYDGDFILEFSRILLNRK